MMRVMASQMKASLHYNKTQTDYEVRDWLHAHQLEMRWRIALGSLFRAPFLTNRRYIVQNWN